MSSTLESLVLKRIDRLPEKALEKNVVYILRSLSDPNLFYCGYTNNIRRRIRQHNGFISGGGEYTKNNRPWILASIIYGKSRELTKEKALRVEYYTKAKNHAAKLQKELSVFGPVEKRLFLIRKSVDYIDTRCKKRYFDRDINAIRHALI